MCSSVAPRLWFLTDRRIREDYPQQEILRALKAKCCEEELDFRALVMDEVVLTIEDGNLDSMVQNFSMWRDFKAKQQNRLKDYELENCVVLVHNTDNGGNFGAL